MTLRPLRAALRLFLFALAVVLALPLQFLLHNFRSKRLDLRFARRFHGLICQIFGLRITSRGIPCTNGQVLYVANHLSYLDIPVLGSLIVGCFISKNDVARWPLIGTLARLQRTAFIDRNPAAARQEQDNIGRRLREGLNMILFPEGTSTDGRSVLPFKSSLFAAVLEGESRLMMIQPITLRLTHVDDQTAETADQRDIYAWHRDMETSFALHLWRFAQHRGAQLDIIFHTPFSAQAHGDRKTLAKAAHIAVSKGLEKDEPISLPEQEKIYAQF
ncbi:MAG: 1-acyl-sn-glycerol-3-phosphate acyltransferase [Alphaproteobacteria bacterium]|nr:1-acyl-sn-glycerol-3-phosphate acyltransferase [Alphaproteobacteria bacterium]